MSQSGRLTLNTPVPGAGIQTITGDFGGAVPGDGAANINIVGSGSIDVIGNAGTNTLTISSTATPAAYTTDNAVAVPDAFGNVNVLGGPNINTDALIANTINVNLDNDVVINNLTVHNTLNPVEIDNKLEVGGTAFVGSFLTVVDNIGTFGGLTTTTFNYLDGTVQFPAFTNGALVVNGTGVMSAINGTTDQVLMAYPGHAPAFGSIVGAGATTVNIGTQGTITISSPAVPAAVTVAGTVNQISVSAGPNYVASLPAAVVTPGSLTTTGALTSNSTLTTTGINRFNNLAVNGVVQTNALHQLTASNGANGTVLIGTGVGNAPAWSTLTAGTNVAITNTPGHISIASTAGAGASVSSFFARQVGDTIAVTGDNTRNFINLGAYAVLTATGGDCFNTGGNLTLGDGVGTPAIYTAPETATYFFNYRIAIAATQAIPFSTIRIHNITSGVNYDTVSFSQLNPSALGVYINWGDATAYIRLVAGDQVTFGVSDYRATPIPNARIVASVVGDNNSTTYTATTFISGFKVA